MGYTNFPWVGVPGMYGSKTGMDPDLKSWKVGNPKENGRVLCHPWNKTCNNLQKQQGGELGISFFLEHLYMRPTPSRAPVPVPTPYPIYPSDPLPPFSSYPLVGEPLPYTCGLHSPSCSLPSRWGPGIGVILSVLLGFGEWCHLCFGLTSHIGHDMTLGALGSMTKCVLEAM